MLIYGINEEEMSIEFVEIGMFTGVIDIIFLLLTLAICLNLLINLKYVSKILWRIYVTFYCSACI